MECRSLSIIRFILLFLLAPFSTTAIESSTYWKQRNSFLDDEQKMMLGHDLELTPKEEMANDILMIYKRAEMREAFENLHFPPALNFLSAREQIEKSDVLRILKLMPKGAALHIHDSPAVPVDWIVSELTYWPNLFMCIKEDGNMLLRFMSVPDSLCDWKRVNDLRSTYPTAEDFDKELLRKMTLMTDTPAEDYPNINAVWSAFERSLAAINGVVKYRPAWEVFLNRLFHELYRDNVQYAEIRTSLSSIYELNGSKLTEEEAIAIYEDVTKSFVEEHKGEFLGSRLIYSAHRSWDVNETWRQVNLAKNLKRTHPAYVAGFDLVGQEDIGAPLKQIIEPLLSLSDGDVTLPVFYHSGETNWMGTEVDENLIDALLLNVTRIGHGYAVLKHPLAKQIAKKRGVAIEVCPVSNQVLMLVKDLRNHPAAALASEGFPIVVSSDGPGLWGSKGLSYDFYEAFMAFGGAKADLRFLKKLALNSIEYSTLGDTEKLKLLQMFQRKWRYFISNLVAGGQKEEIQKQSFCPADNQGMNASYYQQMEETNNVWNYSDL